MTAQRQDTPPGAFRRLTSRLLEVLFPAPCAGCGVALKGAPNPWFCAACWADLPLLEGAVCATCGIPFPAAQVEIDLPERRCGDCLKAPPPFDLARTLGPYGGTLAEAVKLLKYRDQTGLARALAARVAPERFPADLWRVDLVVPVPLHPRRLRARGYNQAAWLARALAPGLGARVADGALLRTAPTAPQVGLSRAARDRNVRTAFQAPAPERIRGRSVLLVDDVITTGATAAACARTLKRAGAARVHVWALARQSVDVEAPARPARG